MKNEFGEAGLGINIVEINTVARGLAEVAYFPKTFCLEEEIVYCESARGRRRTERYSGILAAKRAVLMALGGGGGEDKDFTGREIKVVRKESGQPFIELLDEAKIRALEFGLSSLFISIAHSKSLAAACCIGTRDGERYVGLGIDMLEIQRIASDLAELPDFPKEFCTTEEIAYCDSIEILRSERYTAYFCAKEAVVKALGGGGDKDFTGREIIVKGKGQPFIELTGRATTRAMELGIKYLPISIARIEETAMAFCIALNA